MKSLTPIRPAFTESDRLHQSMARVCLICEEPLFTRMATTISGLGYDVVDGRFGIVAADCIFVVMSATSDPDLDLTSNIAEHHRTILLSDDRGFDLRLKAARAGVQTVLRTDVDSMELAVWLSTHDDAESDSFSILIVDDDDLAARTYALALTAAGMKAEVVTHPEQTIEAVERFAPDLILMDLHMPVAGGLEVAKVIRQTRRHLSLPIVFLSAERDLAKQQEARRIGGDDFIAKPIALETLAESVRIRAKRAVALRQAIDRDSLTNLLSHARFLERLDAEIARSRRTTSPISVCMIDLDQFKGVNDAYGHQAGDHVLQTLARTMNAELRKTDIVARYGGEEFAAILLDTPAEDAVLVMDKLRETFGQIVFDVNGKRFSVTLSAGVGGAAHGATAHDLIAAADRALYRAKHNGRNRVILADRDALPRRYG